MSNVEPVTNSINRLKIKDIAEVVTKGTSPSTYGYAFENTGVNFFKVESLMKNNKIRDDNIYKISFECHDRLSRSKIKENDILFSIAGTLGRMSVIPKSYLPANTNQALAIIRLKKDQYVPYVYWALQSHSVYKVITNIATTGAQPNLSLKQIENLEIISPPFKEQQKIAEILSTVDEQIQQIDQLIEKTSQLKTGIMHELFTKGIGHNTFKQSELGSIPNSWFVTTIESVSLKIMGGGTPSRKNSDFYVGKIPWVTVKDMQGDFYQVDSQEHINEEAIKKSASVLIDPGNIVIATRIALGKGFINTRSIAINQDLKAIYLNNDKIDNEYFLYWYLSIAEFIKSIGSGTTVKGIRVEQLIKLKLPIPPLVEQQKIAEILSCIDEDIEGYKKEKEKYAKLKKGLMQQLLTGRKRVKVD